MNNHYFIISIKNRFEFLKVLATQIKELYEDTDFTPIFSITDFNSSDADIVSFFKEIDIEIIYENFNSNFNLGLGWNNSALSDKIKDSDVIIFTCNDIRFREDLNLPYVINDFTKRGSEIFIPAHHCEDENGDFHFGGGAAFWSCYKSDFKKIGKIPESETWSDAWALGDKKVGEEDYFMHRALRCGLKLNRWNEVRIIGSWHERDFSEKWYSDSKAVIQRDLKNYTPKWWTIT